MSKNTNNTKDTAIWGRFSKRDLLFMGISLFFAVILWIYVLNVENPSREKIVRQVSVSFSGEEKLNSNQKLMVKGDREEILDDVTVVASVPAGKYMELNNNSVKAYVDLSSITSPGTYTLDITASVTGISGVNIVSVSPSEVTVEVDVIRERILPVEISFEGDAQDGYWYSGATITPSTISLTGASSELSQIDRAVCVIDRTSLTSSIYDSVPITLYDADGNEIDGSHFSGDLLFTTVQIDVLPTKTVPVTASSSLMGVDELQTGYQLVGLTINPKSTITIAAEQEILDTITEIPIAPIDLTGMNESVLLYDVELQLPDDVKVVSSVQYNVFVEISEKSIHKDFFDIPIEVRNVTEGLDAELSVTVGKVTLFGQISVIDAFDEDNLKLYVDATGLEEGEHSLSVKIETGDQYSLISPVYSPVSVTLTLTPSP